MNSTPRREPNPAFQTWRSQGRIFLAAARRQRFAICDATPATITATGRTWRAFVSATPPGAPCSVVGTGIWVSVRRGEASQRVRLHGARPALRRAVAAMGVAVFFLPFAPAHWSWAFVKPDSGDEHRMTTSTALTCSGPRARTVPAGTDAKPTRADREPPRVRGFGAPADDGAHHFTVTVPAGRTEHASVRVVEYRGDLTEAVIPRVSLLRWRWRLIEGVLSRSFNQRLRAQHLPTGRWTRGETPVERRFGKELCVLAWGH